MFLCAQCNSPIVLIAFCITRCECGATYLPITTIDNSTAPTWQGIPLTPYRREPVREAVPQAFYDAFKDEEVTP
jgi:hypothetical protein